MLTSSQTAEVSCVLSYRTSVGTVATKTLFSEKQKLKEETASAYRDPDFESSQAGRKRFSFVFEFDSRALPPSLCFDPSDFFEGRPVGVSWQVVGFMGQELRMAYEDVAMANAVANYEEPSLLRRQHPSALNFQVEYRHSLDWLASNPRPPVATASVRPSLFSFGRSTADPTLTSVLEKTLIVPPEPVKISLELSALSSSHTVQKVKLTARQTIVYRLPSGSLHFRALVGQTEETPAPRYDKHNSSFTGSFSLRIAEGLVSSSKGKVLKKKDGKLPAQIMPLDFRNGEEGSEREGVKFVPSTPMIKSVEGTWGVDVRYSVQVGVVLVDSNGGLLSKNKELEVELPFVLTNATDVEPTPPTLFDPIASTSSQTVLLRPDALVPLLSETIDDLDASLSDISALKLDWRDLRDEIGTERMATRASDHAQVLLDILVGLNSQLKTFTDSYFVRDGSVPWPRNPVPFNMLLLETELLARAGPDEGWDFLVPGDVGGGVGGGGGEGPGGGSSGTATDAPIADGTQLHEDPTSASDAAVDALLTRFETYLSTARAIVLAWVASRGGRRDEEDEREFGRKKVALERARDELMTCLEGIASQGGVEELEGVGEWSGGTGGVGFGGGGGEEVRRRVARPGGGGGGGRAGSWRGVGGRLGHVLDT
ncbi:hypothetical protein HDV00_003377 [Rhizophlyctis rosea]|nr:hypothetical protein HDV00_003377 [Rhizophlyctis rosea]